MPPTPNPPQKQETTNQAVFNMVSSQYKAYSHSFWTRYFTPLSYTSQNTLLYPSGHVAISARYNIRYVQNLHLNPPMVSWGESMNFSTGLKIV